MQQIITIIFPINLNITINKGSINIPKEYLQQYNYFNNNNSFITFLDKGFYYCTEIPYSLANYKQNLKEFEKSTNVMTTLASTYFINNNNNDFKKLNVLWKKKLYFTPNDYNFYKGYYYYDYYTTHNGYTYDIIRIIGQIVFLWNLIFNLSKIYNIPINFDFYLTFFTAIFENLSNIQPILSEQINVYFNKYQKDYMPLSYNNIIINWVNLINEETDVIYILIYKQASYVLNIEQLENIIISKIILSKYFNYVSVKNKFLECLSLYCNKNK